MSEFPKLVIAVDIDDTLTIPSPKRVSENYREYYERLEPNKELIKNIIKLHEKGHTIILWTSRYFEDQKVTTAWLEKYKVPFTMIQFGKLRADIYIDTASIQPESGLITQIQAVYDSVLRIHKQSHWVKTYE